MANVYNDEPKRLVTYEDLMPLIYRISGWDRLTSRLLQIITNNGTISGATYGKYNLYFGIYNNGNIEAVSPTFSIPVKSTKRTITYIIVSDIIWNIKGKANYICAEGFIHGIRIVLKTSAGYTISTTLGSVYNKSEVILSNVNDFDNIQTIELTPYS